MTKSVIRNHKIYIGIIFLLAFLARIIFIISQPNFIHFSITPDSDGYFTYGKEIVRNRNAVNDWRTPVYPLFIQLPYFLSARQAPGLWSEQYYLGLTYITVTQLILGSITSVLFYLLSRQIFTNKYISLSLSIFYALNILIIFWDKMILTESLALFLIMIISLTGISLLKKVSTSKAFILLILFIIITFLRPVYILLPVPVLIFILLYQRNVKFLVISAAILLLYFFTVKGYINMNKKQNGYAGLSRIGDVNLFGKIFQNNLPTEGFGKYPRLNAAVNSWKITERNPILLTDPWAFIVKNPDYFSWNPLTGQGDVRAFNEFNQATREVIFSNLPKFFLDNIRLIPYSIIDDSSITLFTQPANTKLIVLFRNIFIFLIKMQFLLLISIPCFLIITIKTWKNSLRVNLPLILCGIIAFYQVIMSTYLSSNQYGRLITPALPFLYILTAYSFNEIRLYLRGFRRR
jgi:hypothetical protein